MLWIILDTKYVFLLRVSLIFIKNKFYTHKITHTKTLNEGSVYLFYQIVFKLSHEFYLIVFQKKNAYVQFVLTDESSVHFVRGKYF